MTARGTRAGGPAEDTDDLDVEEALALVRDHSGHRDPEPARGDAARGGPRGEGGSGRTGGSDGDPWELDWVNQAGGTSAANPGESAASRRPTASAAASASGSGAADPDHPRDARHASNAASRPVRADPTGADHNAGADPGADHDAEHRHADPHPGTAWPRAREIAAAAARAAVRSGARRPVSVTLADALGLVLAAPLTALTDLPPFDTSAMDGWAVAGPGPWAVRDEGVLAGHAQPQPLADGEAVRIATGARVPADATAVLRSEHGRLDAQDRLHAELPRSDRAARTTARATTRHTVQPGQDIRLRGQECRSGDQLLALGTLVTPAVLGLAAAAGYDTVSVVPRPRVEILVLGDELLTEGLPHDGLIRDALGPMLPPWLRALGAETGAVRRVGDDAEALHRAVTSSGADLIVTTGGTAGGPVDHVRPILRRIGAELLVDGVEVRPGHPMLLARTRAGQHLVGLPGNPLAAVSGLLTLAEPLLRTLAARPAPEPYTMPLRDAVHGHPYDTRLVPVVLSGEGAVPLHYNGPAMLRGVATADALAVVPPGGAEQGQETELLDLPWAAAGIGVCFT